jgi:hypothetical protein
MTVDGAAVRDRLAGLVPADSPVAALLDQLVYGMSDAEYAVVATAIVRAVRREARA